MSKKKLDTKTILIIAAVIIGIVIFLWLATKKEAAGAAGNGAVDLINAGTRDYIELRPPAEGNIFVTYYDNLEDSSYAGANIYPSYTNPTFETVVPYFLEMWHNAGRLIQFQFDNAMTQLHNLGY